MLLVSNESDRTIQDLALALAVRCARQLDGQQTASMCSKPSKLSIIAVKPPQGLMKNNYASHRTKREPVACHLGKPKARESE